MSGFVFINYRRDDTANAAGRLYDRLEHHYGEDHLFMDVDKIAGGIDFVEELEQRLEETDVLIVVIGSNWLAAQDDNTGSRRLENPDDFVRLEIERALARDLEVIPLLVDGAAMPRPEDLPSSLHALSRRNAMRLTHERFRADAQGLISNIDQAFDRIRERREAARLEEEAETKRRRAEEARRQQQAEDQRREQARLDAIAGLSPEQISAAEAVANWEFIKESTEPQDFRDHIARYPDHGASVNWARSKLDDLVWKSLGAAPGKGQLQGYLDELPNGKHIKEAKARIKFLENADAEERRAQERRAKEDAAWQAVKETDDLETLNAFLRDYPGGAHASEAARLRRALSGGDARIKRMLRVGGAIFAVIFVGFAIYASIPNSTWGYWAAERRIARALNEGEKELSLYGLNLKELPPEIRSLNDLEALGLGGNEFSGVPPEIFQLTELKTLGLNGLNFYQLPADIGRLVKLRELDLASNRLSDLPAEIGNLPQLQVLNLNHNTLESLPPQIATLSELRRLTLSYNRLRQVPVGVWSLSRLVYLDLSNNSIEQLSSDIGRLTQLKSLQLDQNKVVSLPPEIGNLIGLEQLSIAYNGISALPSSLGRLRGTLSGKREYGSDRLYLYGNPWKPPFDTLAAQGGDAVLAYLATQGQPGQPAPVAEAAPSGIDIGKGQDATGVLKDNPEAFANLLGLIFGQLAQGGSAYTFSGGFSLSGAVDGNGQNYVSVSNVAEGSVAAEKGLRNGDIVLQVNGTNVTSPVEAVSEFNSSVNANGQNVLFQIKGADGAVVFVTLPSESVRLTQMFKDMRKPQ